jgi:hypothetical protein
MIEKKDAAEMAGGRGEEQGKHMRVVRRDA